MRLSTAMLYVKDLPSAVAFYATLLERTPDPASRTAQWAAFDVGGVAFGLHAIPEHLAADIRIGAPPEPREETPYKLLLATADLDAAASRAEVAGGQVRRTPWGGLDVIDPEGNIVGIVAGEGA